MATRFRDLVPTTYPLSDSPEASLDRCRRSGGPDRWAVRSGGWCLTRDGQWEFEPLPSNRTEEFFARCRFDTPEQALAVWDRVMGVKA